MLTRTEERFLDLSGITSLSEIRIHPTTVEIGAGVTWTQAIDSSLPAWFDGVRLAAREVGGKQVQNRGTVAGRAVAALEKNPLPREKFRQYGNDNLSRPARMGKLDAIVNHMGNFFDCVRSRKKPISDVVSQHQSATTCHLGNISMELGRPLKWNPKTERFVNDPAADKLLRREQRSGFEVV